MRRAVGRSRARQATAPSVIAVLIAFLFSASPAAACPFFDVTGDGAYVRLADSSAVYSEYEVDKGWGYHDHHRWSYNWGWDLDGVTTINWPSQKLKEEEAIMDQEGNQVLDALHNLNDDSSFCFVGIWVVDALSGDATPVSAGNWWMPCQLRQIAKGYWDSGDTSRFGRVGEVLAVVSLIVLFELALWSSDYRHPSWYWSTRHVFAPTPAGIVYLQVNPDFTIKWSRDIEEVWEYWFGYFLGYHWQNFENGDYDAMEVKTTKVTDWKVQVCLAEDQLLLLGGFSAYLATGVKMTDSANQDVYFEIDGAGHTHFKFQAYC